MHIGFFTNAYYPTVSGVVRSVSSFRDALAEEGHHVFIFAPHASEYLDAQPIVFRYPAIDIPKFPQFPFAIPISNCMDRVLPSLKLEVVHSHHPVLLGQTAVAKAEELRLPIIFTFHTRNREYSHYFAISQDFVKEQIDNWLRDVYDHTIQIIDTVETFRDMVSGMLDIYQSSISNRMNEVMKVLTIIATIFIPLSFFTGLYGMNFVYIPELQWRWGYFGLLGFLGSVFIGMLIFFKHKKWI